MSHKFAFLTEQLPWSSPLTEYVEDNSVDALRDWENTLTYIEQKLVVQFNFHYVK